jgi:hypothetical protein
VDRFGSHDADFGSTGIRENPAKAISRVFYNEKNDLLPRSYLGKR